MRAMQRAASEAIRRLRGHLDRTLFKSAPDGGSGLSTRELAVLAVGFLALATVLQLFRAGPDNALDSLWAEDGPVFLQGAIEHDFWTDVWTTYAGYLVLVPRLIGLAGHAVPLEDAPVVITLLSAAVISLCGLVAWVASAAHLRNPWLRGTMVALVVFAPTASLESVLSASYVLWFMLIPVFWLLLWRPRTTRGAVLGGIFILFTALTTPSIWFLLPLAALRLLAVRDRRDGILVGSYALGSVVQAAAIALQNEEQVDPLWSHDIWTAYLQRVLDGAAFGERVGGLAWDLLGWPLLIALLLLGVAGLVLGLRRSDAATRWLVALTVPTSVGMFVVLVYQRAVGPQMAWPSGDHFGAAGRYTIVPALLLAIAALVLVEAAARRRPAIARLLTGATVAVLLGGLLTSFYVGNGESRGTPAWSDALDAAGAECEAPGATSVVVPISPQPFVLAVPCDEIGE